MDKPNRRTAIRDYKERKTAPGIYAIRCEATGAVWVGVSQNIDAQANGVRFTLRMANHPNRELQAALRAHGADAFAYEVLERIDDEELTPLGRADLLKLRERHWIEALGARKAA